MAPIVREECLTLILLLLCLRKLKNFYTHGYVFRPKRNQKKKKHNKKMITSSYVLTPLMNKKKFKKCQQKNMLLLRTIEMYILQISTYITVIVWIKSMFQ